MRMAGLNNILSKERHYHFNWLYNYLLQKRFLNTYRRELTIKHQLMKMFIFKITGFRCRYTRNWCNSFNGQLEYHVLMDSRSHLNRDSGQMVECSVFDMQCFVWQRYIWWFRFLWKENRSLKLLFALWQIHLIQKPSRKVGLLKVGLRWT